MWGIYWSKEEERRVDEAAKRVEPIVCEIVEAIGKVGVPIRWTKMVLFLMGFGIPPVIADQAVHRAVYSSGRVRSNLGLLVPASAS